MYIKRVQMNSNLMRKIEREMQNAIRNGQDWSKANTSVDFDQEGFMTVRLHGNRICEMTPSGDLTLSSAGWQTVTTKSRLNAILDCFLHGVGIYQKNFEWFIGSDEFFDGYRITR